MFHGRKNGAPEVPFFFLDIMKRVKYLLILLASFAAVAASAQDLPSRFDVKFKSKSHVQGVAVDTVGRCFYLSFTTSLVKCDYSGNVLASIDSINGHLGALCFDAASRRVYATLEHKDDEIGRGIAERLGAEAYSREGSRFYIASCDASLEGGLTLYEVDEARDDYKTRYGCSGIDGITIAPKIGSSPGKPCLYVAYGIYGDISRSDNDNQILLEYRLDRFKGGRSPRPSARYFIYTGNTNYGVQNLCYDAATGCIFMAAYAGSKPEFPNYSLFAVPVAQKPVKQVPAGLSGCKQLTLGLWQQGLLSSVKGIRGWRFSDAATGFCTLGNGTWYVATPKKLLGKRQTATVRRLRWKGGPSESPFEAVR